MRGHGPGAAGQRGASLVELLVVAFIVGLLAAVVVPSLVAAVRAAREARAVANLKALGAAQMTLYSTERRFGPFGRLFREGYLSDGQFRRVRAVGGPSEEVSDGVYLYSFRFDKGAAGLTIDADPDATYRTSHRWFRYRLGRVTRSKTSGGEGVLYAAPPRARPPRDTDYALFTP